MEILTATVDPKEIDKAIALIEKKMLDNLGYDNASYNRWSKLYDEKEKLEALKKNYEKNNQLY